MAFEDFYPNTHLFQIQCSVKDAESSIEFLELENELGGGFYSQILYGSELGDRSWKLTFPALKNSSANATVVGINGDLLTPARYLWDLFCEQKVTGVPFAYKDPETGGYYLARFADKKLSYNRVVAKLASSGIEIKQWRIENETVYYPVDLSGIYGWYLGETFPAPFPGGWENTVTGNGDPSQLLLTGNVAATGTLNGIATVQFNVGGTNDGFLSTAFAPSLVRLKEIFILMKMREATFSNFAGIITGPTAGGTNIQTLIGDSGTTKFLDPANPLIEYRLNGTLYANNNRQAPMNDWGIVHLRYPTGWLFDEIQVGKDRDFAGRFAEVDIAQMFFFTDTQPMNVRREITEYWQTKFDLS